MQREDDKMMNISETLKKLRRANPAMYNEQSFTKHNLLEILNYYKKLNVIYITEDEQFTFL